MPQAQLESGDARGNYADFVTKVLSHTAAASRTGALCFLGVPHQRLIETIAATRDASLEWLDLCIWNKDIAEDGAFYRAKHELILVLRNGAEPIGKPLRRRTNVWTYATVKEASQNTAGKPAALVADAIKDACPKDEIVLDPFGGCGTTLIAAEKTGRRAALIEGDPARVDLALRRWQNVADESAILQGKDLSFAELVRARMRC